MFITAKLCGFAKLCTVSPVDESMVTWLATCNEALLPLLSLRRCPPGYLKVHINCEY